MRIVLLTSHAKTLTNFRLELLQSLVDQEHTVFTLAPDFDSQTQTKLLNLGVTPVDIKLSRTGFNPFVDLIDTLKLMYCLRKLRPDILFSYSTKPVIYGSIAGFFAQIKKRVSMIEGLGFAFTDTINSQTFKQKALRTLVSKLYKVALSLSHKVLFLNRDDLKQFVDLKIVKNEKCIMFGGIGVDLDYWHAIVPTTQPITFILVARILREKGIYEYIEAIKKIKTRFSQIKFVIIGDFDSNPGAIPKHQITSWVNEGLIEWPGFVNPKEWLEKSSVFVLPSYREGVPRSSQEALALGLPIITTNVPGCKETVLTNTNGFLIPVRDSVALESAMLKFIENPDLIRTMGQESRKMAESLFDVRQKTKTLVSILEN